MQIISLSSSPDAPAPEANAPDDGVPMVESAAEVDDDGLSLRALVHEADRSPTVAHDRARPASAAPPGATADVRRPRHRKPGPSKLSNLKSLQALTALLSIGLLIGWFLPWLDRPQRGPLKDKQMIGPRVAWGGAVVMIPSLLDDPEAADRTSGERALTSIGATLFGAGALLAALFTVVTLTRNRPIGSAAPAMVVAMGGVFLFYAGAGGTGIDTPRPTSWPEILGCLSAMALALTLLQVDWSWALRGLATRQTPTSPWLPESLVSSLRWARAKGAPGNYARRLAMMGIGLALVAVWHYPMFSCNLDGRFAIGNSGAEIAPMYSFVSEAVELHKEIVADAVKFEPIMGVVGSILKGEWIMTIGVNICAVGVFLTLVVALGLASDYMPVFRRPFCVTSGIVGCGMVVFLVGFIIMFLAIPIWRKLLPRGVEMTLEVNLAYGFYLAAIQTLGTGIAIHSLR